MRTLKQDFRKTSRQLSFAMFISAMSVLFPKTIMAQTAYNDKYVMRHSTSGDGDGEYIRNLRSHGFQFGMAFSTWGTLRMMIDKDGQVGIGTTDTGQLDNIGGKERSLLVYGPNSAQSVVNNDNVFLGMSVVDFNAYIGTRTAHALNFIVEDNVKMHITNQGDVGIGTTVPDLSNNANTTALNITGPRVGVIHMVSTGINADTEVEALFSLNSFENLSQNRPRALRMGTTTDHIVELMANDQTGVTLKYNETSNMTFMGIGTKDPLAPLHVEGYIRGINAFNGISIFQSEDGLTSLGVNGNRCVIGTDVDEIFLSKPLLVNQSISSFSGNLSLSTGNGNAGAPDVQMTIAQTTGNVGIGEAPDNTHKLKVNGTIKASSFISSAASFPDYVFSDDYALIPLEAIDAYVKEHRHLPNMPSEQEVVENGLNIPLVLDKSVENIETIYLYLIEMQESLKQLEEKVKALEQENNTLKAARNHSKPSNKSSKQ